MVQRLTGVDGRTGSAELFNRKFYLSKRLVKRYNGP